MPAFDENIRNQKQYYTLLVGINNYPDPISSLSGCIKDLDQVESYLRAQFGKESKEVINITSSDLQIRNYGELHICRLQNENATYKNIILAFQEFLCEAKSDDIVWFHFSGHGSEQFTPEEFLEIEPGGKDQTLVCYPVQGTDNFHLADKELAYLLYEIENANKKNPKDGSPHIMVTLDCCHSGTGTRDFEMNPDIKSRKIDSIHGLSRAAAIENGKGIRQLNSYFGNYHEQLIRNQRIEIPLAKHVLLSACESVQLAGDMSSGGIFTSAMINALYTSGGHLNYTDLHIRTRIAIQKIRHREQTPQLETLGGFDPYTRFLDGATFGSPKSYEVYPLVDDWLIACGAIHGIPMSSSKPALVEIYTPVPENKLLGMATLENVGAQKSILHFEKSLNLDKEKIYQATLRYLPIPPVLVFVHGAKNGVEALKNVWDDSHNIQMVENLMDYGDAQLEVEVGTESYLLEDRHTNTQIIEWPFAKDKASLDVIDILHKIVNWERTLNLHNENSVLKDWFDFEIDLAQAANPKNIFQTVKEQETFIKVDDTNFYEKDGAKVLAFIPYIRSAFKPNQNLYFYLFHLRSDYSINSYEGVFIYRPKEYESHSRLEIPLLKKLKAWGIGPDDNSTTTYFKLFITTEAMDYQPFIQSGIHDKDRGEPDLEFNPLSINNDWYSITRKVILEKT